jgi:hypothetical protein
MDAKRLKQLLDTNITESAMLDRYLLSRGIQPKYATKDTKVAHSKSNQFKTWLMHHQNEEVQLEDMGHMATKGEGGKTVDRASDLQKAKSAYKEIKTPKGPGSQHEEVEQIDELSIDTLKSYHQKAAKTIFDKPRKGIARAVAKRREKEGKKDGGGPEKEYAKARPGKYMGDGVQIDAELVEAKLSAAARLQKAMGHEQDKIERERRWGKEFLTKKPTTPEKQDHDPHSQTPKMTQEDVGDAKAAVNADGLPNPQLEPVNERRKQLSKSARMIKALYKSKGMKEDVVQEDLYDHEKEDKSVATYGKKPKLDQADPKDSKGENKPKAAAVLSGGTTLTGQKRDDIEIDPMMRARPGQPDPTKKKEGDKDKDEKKKDK